MNGTFDLSTGYRKCLILGVDSNLTQMKVNDITDQLKRALPSVNIIIVPGLTGAYAVRL